MKRLIGKMAVGAVAAAGVTIIGYLTYRGAQVVFDEYRDMKADLDSYEDEFDDDFDDEEDD